MTTVLARNIDTLTEDQKRRLGEVYRLLLSLTHANETAGRGEFGDLALPAVGDVPATEDKHNVSVHQMHGQDK
jgi:hypothetical protein